MQNHPQTPPSDLPCRARSHTRAGRRQATARETRRQRGRRRVGCGSAAMRRRASKGYRAHFATADLRTPPLHHRRSLLSTHAQGASTAGVGAALLGQGRRGACKRALAPSPPTAGASLRPAAGLRAPCVMHTTTGKAQLPRGARFMCPKRVWAWRSCRTVLACSPRKSQAVHVPALASTNHAHALGDAPRL